MSSPFLTKDQQQQSFGASERKRSHFLCLLVRLFRFPGLTFACSHNRSPASCTLMLKTRGQIVVLPSTAQRAKRAERLDDQRLPERHIVRTQRVCQLYPLPDMLTSFLPLLASSPRRVVCLLSGHKTDLPAISCKWQLICWRTGNTGVIYSWVRQ